MTSAVAALDLCGPGQEVGYALPRWLASDPQLKILWSVVVLDAIDVVDVLSGKQESADLALHHQSVLKDAPRVVGPRVMGRPLLEIAGSSSSNRARLGVGPPVIPASPAGHRFGRLRATAVGTWKPTHPSFLVSGATTLSARLVAIPADTELSVAGVALDQIPRGSHTNMIAWGYATV